MIYDIRHTSNRTRLLTDAAMEGDDCPVDDVCDSVPSILQYVQMLEETIRNYKNNVMKLSADLASAEKKINNLKSQKFRQIKKRGK